jgi:hypothetical protein
MTPALGLIRPGELANEFGGNSNENEFFDTRHRCVTGSGFHWRVISTEANRIDYPGAAGTSATGTNNAGQIVGAYFNTPYVDQGFTDFSGVFSTVVYPGADISGLTGINDEGQVVGSWGGPSAVDDYDIHGFVATPIPGTHEAQRGNVLKGKILAPRN